MLRTAVELARTAGGLVNTIHPQGENTVARRGVQIAGARHVAQAALTLAFPQLRPFGIAVDALHALSMLGVVASSSRYRRPALVQALFAACLACAELRAMRVPRPPRKRRGRRR